jgi:hypothetical protein
MRKLNTMADAQAQKLAYPIEDVPGLAGVGRTSVFLAVKTGKLRAKKFGRRTIVLDHHLKEFYQKRQLVI